MMKSNVSLGNASVDLSEVAAVGALGLHGDAEQQPGHDRGARDVVENESFQGADGGFDEVLAHGALHMRRWKAAKWQLRWFELTQHDLLYYSSQEDATPRGVLPLECIIAVERAADPKTFTLVVVGDAAKAKAMHGTADGKGRSVDRRAVGGPPGLRRRQVAARAAGGEVARRRRRRREAPERAVGERAAAPHALCERAGVDDGGGGAVGKWFGVPLAAAPRASRRRAGGRCRRCCTRCGRRCRRAPATTA